MNKKIVINSEVNAALPNEVKVGEAFLIQVAPRGNYPQYVDDPDKEGQVKEVIQVLDDTAIQTMVDNFAKKKAEFEEKHAGAKYGVLVDADHSSEISTDTKAMAWVRSLSVDPEKGLMAEIEPTTLGAEVINGKVYRFVSGAWTLDDDNRPETLVSIGLTNKPNLPVSPIINSQGKKNAAGVIVSTNDNGTLDGSNANPDGKKKGEQSATNSDSSQINNNGETQMNIKQKLGLAEEATDAEVEAALDALIARSQTVDAINEALELEPDEGNEVVTNEDTIEAVNNLLTNCTALNEANEEAQEAQLNAEAEQLVAENEEVIPEEDVEEIKEEYVADPEGTKEKVANMRRVYERAVLNAKKEAPAKKEHLRIVNHTAKKPVVNSMAAIMNACKGDPAKMNAMIAEMGKKA